MAGLKFKPVRHSHREFLTKAATRKGFVAAYDALALEYQVAGQMLKARSRVGLTQDVVAERMGTTKSAVSRLESAGKHAPSLATLAIRQCRFDRITAMPHDFHLRDEPNGLNTLTSKCLKSATFRVTTVSLCTVAVAAIIASS